MSPTEYLSDAGLALSALAAGAVNSVAGGGTLLTFPALLRVVTPVVANATSTVALVPGSAAGAWGYRKEITELPRWAAWLVLPSIVGGAVGTWLVLAFPEKVFDALIPYLILTAALLFLVQPLLAPRADPAAAPRATPRTVALVVAFQFVVAVYGGYFGAGIGILMITSLSLMGIGDIRHVNALKTALAACINAASVVLWVASGSVNGRYAGGMVVASIVGGYLGARLGRRLPRGLVRWLVIGIGFGLAAFEFARRYAG